ncbi:hypothetical protein MIR68_009749 [Amoeboaphelidium protococcarum]|nr:hypothetical protein MIR68_009749 [Amoeboaphelidium protococcarum]
MTIDQELESILPQDWIAHLRQMPLGDPVLVVLWNEDRLAAVAQANPEHSKRNVIRRLIENGGRDPEGSGSIFHFPMTNNIAAARRDFLRNASWSMGTTPEMRRDLLAPVQDAIAETYMIIRVTKTDLDYQDAQFFYY